jgi:hypothetical protein
VTNSFRAVAAECLALAHSPLAVTLALLGLLDEARATALAGLNLDPGFTSRGFRTGAASEFLTGRERMYEGTRMAGALERSTFYRTARR